MKRRRVKITGIGPVTPAGVGREAFSKGIYQRESCVREFRGIDSEYGSFVAAFIEDFDIENYVKRSVALKGAARHTLFAVAGAALAIADARLTIDQVNALNPVFVAGSSVMDFDGICRTIDSVLENGVRGALARSVYTANAACIPATAANALRVNARTMSIQSSCCAGLDAVGYAAGLVANGETDLAICGGTEAPLARCPLVELRAAGLTPATTERAGQINRPFDRWRTTGVVSEGASMFVLEPESSPRPGLSFVAGYAYANDPLNENCGGMVEAMRRAMASAGLRPGDIDSINAWGPGHWQIDAAETEMLRRVFGDLLKSVPVCSIKGLLGNPLGAAPALQLASVVCAQAHSMLPPTVNWQFPDPHCDLNLSGNERPFAHRMTLINAHGLSGVNASMVVEKC